MIVLWCLAVAGGLGVAIAASRWAVRHAAALSSMLRLPPFLVGLTLVAVGTDLPEIANSVSASLAQHGDLNIGDSVGSVMTQLTLVLGLLPLLAGSFRVGRVQVAWAGSLTCLGLLVAVLLLRDGRFARLDGALLLVLWICASALVWRAAPRPPELPFPREKPAWLRHTTLTLVALALVGAGAAVAVAGLIRISSSLGVPEYLISFFAASLGTSLPELVVDLGALRSGRKELAVGNIFGSSLADATLSLGTGPLVMPTAVTAGFAVRGGLVATGVVLLLTLLFSRIRRHDWRSGLLLLVVYASLYPLLLR